MLHAKYVLEKCETFTITTTTMHNGNFLSKSSIEGSAVGSGEPKSPPSYNCNSGFSMKPSRAYGTIWTGKLFVLHSWYLQKWKPLFSFRGIFTIYVYFYVKIWTPTLLSSLTLRNYNTVKHVLSDTYVIRSTVSLYNPTFIFSLIWPIS